MASLTNLLIAQEKQPQEKFINSQACHTPLILYTPLFQDKKYGDFPQNIYRVQDPCKLKSKLYKKLAALKKKKVIVSLPWANCWEHMTLQHRKLQKKVVSLCRSMPLQSLPLVWAKIFPFPINCFSHCKYIWIPRFIFPWPDRLVGKQSMLRQEPSQFFLQHYFFYSTENKIPTFAKILNFSKLSF